MKTNHVRQKLNKEKESFKLIRVLSKLRKEFLKTACKCHQEIRRNEAVLKKIDLEDIKVRNKILNLVQHKNSQE